MSFYPPTVTQSAAAGNPASNTACNDPSSRCAGCKQLQPLASAPMQYVFCQKPPAPESQSFTSITNATIQFKPIAAASTSKCSCSRTIVNLREGVNARLPGNQKGIMVDGMPNQQSYQCHGVQMPSSTLLVSIRPDTFPINSDNSSNKNRKRSARSNVIDLSLDDGSISDNDRKMPASKTPRTNGWAVREDSLEIRKQQEQNAMLLSNSGRAFKLVETMIQMHKQVLAEMSRDSSQDVTLVGQDDMVFLAENFIACQQSFRASKKPTHVSLAYHYTNEQHLQSIRQDGLLSYPDRQKNKIDTKHQAYFGEGVYTSNNPYGFRHFGNTGLICAVLRGEEVMGGAGGTVKSNINTVIGNKSQSKHPLTDEIVLRESRQVLPIIRFRTNMVNESKPRIDDDKLKLHQKQQRLLLLWHSTRCKYEAGCPTTPLCAMMKQLWKHLETCKDLQCSVHFCSNSRRILTHYTNCKDAKCTTCGPVRNAEHRSNETANQNNRVNGSTNHDENDKKSSVVDGNKNQANEKNNFGADGTSPQTSSGSFNHSGDDVLWRFHVEVQKILDDFFNHGVPTHVERLTPPSTVAGANQAHTSSSFRSPVTTAAAATATASGAAPFQGGSTSNCRTQKQKQDGTGTTPKTSSQLISIVQQPQLKPTQQHPTPWITSGHYIPTRAIVFPLGPAPLPSPLPAYPPHEVLPYSAPKSLVAVSDCCLRARTLSRSGGCGICSEKLLRKGKVFQLKSCSHLFHSECITNALQRDTNCPQCHIPLSNTPQGKSPSGALLISYSNAACEGFPGTGSIVLRYSFPAGTQLPYHEAPGRPYHSTYAAAFLPNNAHGSDLLKRLKYAWGKGLLFGITGNTGQIVWRCAQQKSALSGGPHVFPDLSYFSSVNSELDRLGVPPSCQL